MLSNSADGESPFPKYVFNIKYDTLLRASCLHPLGENCLPPFSASSVYTTKHELSALP